MSIGEPVLNKLMLTMHPCIYTPYGRRRLGAEKPLKECVSYVMLYNLLRTIVPLCTTPLNADVHCNGYAHDELVTLEKYVLSVASQLASA